MTHKATDTQLGNTIIEILTGGVVEADELSHIIEAVDANWMIRIINA